MTNYDFELIKNNYTKLRAAIIKYLDHFDEDGYFYQPTTKSNAVAWIIPHIVAFEKVMVTDKIPGFDFDSFISQEDVDKYKPGVDGFTFKKESMLSKEEAIALLEKAQSVLLPFLEALAANDTIVKEVNKKLAFDKFMLNFSHETEHFGQVKYLLGTYKRTR